MPRRGGRHGGGSRFAVVALAGRWPVEENSVLVERVEGGPMPLGDQVVGMDHVGEHTAGFHDTLVVGVIGDWQGC